MSHDMGFHRTLAAAGFVIALGSIASRASAATTITQQPSNQTACAGGTASFTVTASGTGTLTYQWRKGNSKIKNGGHYSGATTATLTITGASSGDVASNYNCAVTGGSGSATSNNASFALRAATRITGQPANRASCRAMTCGRDQ